MAWGAALAAWLIGAGAAAAQEPGAAPRAKPAETSAQTSAQTSAGRPAGAPAAPASAAGETIDDAVCRLVDGAAQAEGIPASFFTRLIWRESAFRTDVVSRAGAQGIAQFMPATARERGLENPFDPEHAIPASAKLLADLLRQFGNLGLAAAAYNAGPGRVNGFLAGGGLPAETRTYVQLITGMSAQDWAALKRQGGAPPAFPAGSCRVTLASLRQGAPLPAGAVSELFAPWGVQLSGNFSRERALASFRRTAERYRAVIADQLPVIISTRTAGRGARPFYRVRLPAGTREAAARLCDRLRQAGGACVVLPN
ncbi:lytic transglycosylase domain-containing protein [Xanthobacter sp. KR7-225]|uniref:lytic transglycosylase domain-containing protein n=1 Tax=Xanthobacter sp. KR7-225 TaxID=3156613 RepID=UPI0032B4A6EF